MEASKARIGVAISGGLAASDIVACVKRFSRAITACWLRVAFLRRRKPFAKPGNVVIVTPHVVPGHYVYAAKIAA
jgi:hypothetical protein